MFRPSQIALVVALLAAAAMWCYADFVLVPHQQAQSAAMGIPRGNLSDLYPRWFGSRELLLRHRDPYSDEVTREIQAGYYGRELDPSRPNDPKDQQGFAYPVYVAFLLAPTITSPFPAVLTAFRWSLALLTAATIPLWSRAVGLRMSRLTTVTWIVITLGSFAAVQGIKLQQLTLFVCGLLAGAMAALAAGHLVTAGVLLAFATIKPQLAGILIAWLVLWALSDWRRRKPFVFSFSATLLALVLAGEALLPGWVFRFQTAASAYLRYTGGGKSVLDVALGTLGKWMALVVVLAIAMFVWKYRQSDANQGGFTMSLVLVLAATLAIIPTYAPYNQLLLLPVLMVLVRQMPIFWRGDRVSRLFFLTTALTLVWPWIAAAVLSVALLFVPAAQLRKAWALPLLSSLYIPMTVLGLTLIGVWRASGRRMAT